MKPEHHECANCGHPHGRHDSEWGCHEQWCRCDWVYYPDEGGMGPTVPNATRQEQKS